MIETTALTLEQFLSAVSMARADFTSQMPFITADFSSLKLGEQMLLAQNLFMPNIDAPKVLSLSDKSADMSKFFSLPPIQHAPCDEKNIFALFEKDSDLAVNAVMQSHAVFLYSARAPLAEYLREAAQATVKKLTSTEEPPARTPLLIESEKLLLPDYARLFSIDLIKEKDARALLEAMITSAMIASTRPAGFKNGPRLNPKAILKDVTERLKQLSRARVEKMLVNMPITAGVVCSSDDW